MIEKEQAIARPSHYSHLRFQVEVDAFDFICLYSFAAGNVLKYVLRAGHKTDDPLPDLIKARTYAERMDSVENVVVATSGAAWLREQVFEHLPVLRHFISDRGIIDRTAALAYIKAEIAHQEARTK